jgi:thioredoxin-dependent peroxiredoxin
MKSPRFKVGKKDHHIQNDMLKVGEKAPDFILTTNGQSTRSLADYDGKVKIISCIPSIDTRVCAAQTRRFNEEAASLNNTVVLTVSADSPFALQRFCGNEGIENTETLSTYRDMKFADDYGVHDLDWRMTQRAVFVIDKDNIVQYAEYMSVIGDEVNFIAALAKAQNLT